MRISDWSSDVCSSDLFGHEDRGAAASLRPVQPAQRAHEGDRLARLHAGIKTALLGQIADAVAHGLRLVAAQQAAGAGVGVDDAQHHAQHSRLARAIGTEQAVDAARRPFERDMVGRTNDFKNFGWAWSPAPY